MSRPGRLPVHPLVWVVLPPALWLVLFLVAPFFTVAKISVAEAALAQPPFTPLWRQDEAGTWSWHLVWDNYRLLLEDGLYRAVYVHSLQVAASTTLLCLLIGYPMAYAISRSPPRRRPLLLLLLMLPFWTSLLIRVYAWMGLLKDNGVINGALLAAGLIDKPLGLLYSDFAVYTGIVYTYLPFMVLPLYAAIAGLDRALLEAAADLGSRPWSTFRHVTLPQTLPGIAAGSLLVFIPAVGEFVIPDLLGGPDNIMIGKLVWTEFFSNHDWPVAAALTVVMMLSLLLPIAALFRARARTDSPGGVLHDAG